MNKTKIFIISTLILFLGIGLTAWLTMSKNTTNSNDNSTTVATFDASDEKTEYTSVSNNINLSDYANGSVIKIESAGEYTLTGELSDGQIVVNVDNEDKVQLYLNNAQITNNSGSAILVENAKKVIITLNDGTDNYLTDGSAYSNLDDDGNPNATIFSHDDLTINGAGSLTVTANYANAIESRDDLKITGGNITVNAINTGIFGNNSFEMKEANITVTAEVDAIHSDGDIIIESGSLTLNSGDDGIHADGTLTVNDGTITVEQSYEGLEATDVVINGGNINITSNEDGINGAGGNNTDTTQDRFRNTTGSITITGGDIFITPALTGNGDGVDSNGTLTITGGDLVVKMPSTYRDYSSIDYETTFSLTGGQVRILNTDGSYTQVTEDNVSSVAGMGGGMPGMGGGANGGPRR